MKKMPEKKKSEVKQSSAEVKVTPISEKEIRTCHVGQPVKNPVDARRNKE